VAGPRESKEPGVYDWNLTMLRFLNRARDPRQSHRPRDYWGGIVGRSRTDGTRAWCLDLLRPFRSRCGRPPQADLSFLILLRRTKVRLN
jgi:hypothetical protein